MVIMWKWIFASIMLQLCRAEILDTQHEFWYSANIINEGYHPKPITEIFSTEPTFSRSNPIIILPKSSMSTNDMIFWSNYAPSLRTFSNTEHLLSKTGTSPTQSTILTSCEETDPTSTTAPFTSQLPESTLGVSMQTEPEQSTVKETAEAIGQVIPSTKQAKSEESTNTQSPQRAETISLVSQSNTTIQPQKSTDEPSQSQAAAQTLSESIITPESFSSTVPSTTPSSTLPTTIFHRTFSNIPSSFPTYPTPSSSFATFNPQSVSDIPLTTPKPSFPLRIRVLASPGFLTNVKINPTTITKTSTTVRTKKLKPKNLYKVCTDSCEGAKTPICAAPSTKGLIDPSTLKGFASICHMACYNTFKEQRYEKLVDGRCGKLRTRIRPVDSKHKLKRTELTKTEYTVENDDSQAIVEFSGLV